jgi:uncharacterized protein YeaO (DUF488 family)
MKQRPIGLKRAYEAPAAEDDASRRGPVTLVYGSHDTKHSAAVALREYVARRAARTRG